MSTTIPQPVNPFPALGLNQVTPEEAMDRVVEVLGEAGVLATYPHSDPLEIGYLLAEDSTDATVAGLWEVYELPDGDAAPAGPRPFVMVPPLTGSEDGVYSLDCYRHQCTVMANRYEIGLAITHMWLAQLWQKLGRKGLTSGQAEWMAHFYDATCELADQMPGDGPSVFFYYTD